MKYTRKPWQVTRSSDYRGRGYDPRVPKHTYYLSSRTESNLFDMVPDWEAANNARLSSAAPDLLEALQDCVTMLQSELESCCDDTLSMELGNTISMANRAIRMAVGEDKPLVSADPIDAARYK